MINTPNNKSILVVSTLLTGFLFGGFNQTFGQAIPIGPVSLKATISSYGKINLSWMDDSSNEKEFRVSRRQAYVGSWAVIGTVKENATSFNDTVNPGSYDYRVNACNDYGCSWDSNIITVTIDMDTVMPTVPPNFDLEVISATQIDLSWGASTDNIGIDSYHIYRSVNIPSNFVLIASVSSSQKTYYDKTLNPTTGYYYYIKAEDVPGNKSLATNILEGITPALPSDGKYIRLTYPNGGECFSINTKIPITWTGVGINQANVYYGSKGGSNRLFTGNATFYDWYVTASISETTNASIYVVYVDDKGNEGIYDKNDGPFTISLDCKSVKVQSTSIPNRPTYFRASLVHEKPDVLLSWQDNSTNETEFRIYKKLLTAKEWQLVAKVGSNIASYTEVNAPPGDYEYDATACNSAGCSPYSDPIKITTHATLLPVVPGKIYLSSELKSGDMISASNSNDPDIYIVNDYGYKRLFLNPIIFGFYGHLGGFGNVKGVEGGTRDTYKTSGLFRNCEINDEKVYGVEITGEDEGTLHWVNTTGEQAVADDPDFFKKVFCINNNEFKWYKQGVFYSSVNQIPAYSR